MGQGPSLQEKRLAQLELFSEGLFTSKHWHGIGIDSCLLSYSGLNSNEELVRYRDQLFDVPSAIEKLGRALAGLKAVHNAVGLGALVISMILESIGEKTMGTAEMLQRVFADEKAKEVRDLMEEYLKRLRINLRKPQLQLAETRQIELDLSAQLTRLKNSMLVDGHLDSRLLKQWVNGAAIHTQMLIHQARLEEADESRAVGAAGVYQEQLNVIMDRYKKYLNGITSIHNMGILRLKDHVPGRCLVLYFNEGPLPRHEAARCYVEYDLCITGTELVEHLFSKQQISWTKSYFSDLAADIPTLVRQHAAFQIGNRH